MGAASEKALLREQMRVVRVGIPATERAERGQRIEERLLALPQVAAAKSVLLYDAVGTEVPTRELRRQLHAAGVRVLLPFLNGDSIEAGEVEPGEELAPSRYGPGEPPGRKPADPKKVDVVVTPGLAFDPEGRRLGFGGGHYDRFLARLRPKALRVGVAYDEQILESLPEEDGDVRVHLVVTDTRVVRGDETAAGPDL